MEGIYLHSGAFITKECIQNALAEFSNKNNNCFPITDHNDLFIGEGSLIDNDQIQVYLTETYAKVVGASGLYGKFY
jgi:hypothetical protein